MLLEETDSRGITTRYAYDQEDFIKAGLLTTVTTPMQTFDYFYHKKNDRLVESSADLGTTTSINTNRFQYHDVSGHTQGISHNGFSYNFNYDSVGRISGMNIGTSPFITRSYDNTALTTTTSYANGNSITVKHDQSGNPVRKTVNGTVVSTAEYDARGNLRKIVDKIRNICYNYYYNSVGTLVRIEQRQDSDNAHRSTKFFEYDSQNRLLNEYNSQGNVEKNYIYKKTSSGAISPDNVLLGIEVPNKYTEQFVVDSLNRPAAKTFWRYPDTENMFCDTYMYEPYENIDTEQTRNLISSVASTCPGGSETWGYTYDAAGNITLIEKNGEEYARYTYDPLSRLTKEEYPQKDLCYSYGYDAGGNIIYKGNASYSKSYQYDSVWKDKLTQFGNYTFSYDANGNPTGYKGETLQWTRGRLLSRYGDQTFTYGADGIRYQKNNTTYVLDGSTILQESDGVKTLTYHYGATGVVGFNYNNKDYYYRKNLQGDVVAIYDQNWTRVAEYEYTAFGETTVTHNNADDIANINPFRYRSYYYDVETGLYYLETRYYDPETGRFLNPDTLDYLGEGSEFNNHNLFAYCGNNPVMYSDPTGHSLLAAVIIGAVIGAVIGFGATVYADYEDDGTVFNGSIGIGSYLANTLVGGVVGGFIGGFGTSTFTFAIPKLAFATTSIGTTQLVVCGTASVAISGVEVLSGIGAVGLGILCYKGSKPRLGHNQHENQMWKEAMRQLNIKDKDLMRRLHNAIQNEPYQETLKGLINMLKEILQKWGKI